MSLNHLSQTQIAFILLCVFTFSSAMPVSQVFALDDEHRVMANAAVNRGIEYLRTTQNEDGSWSPRPGPAVTALVLTVFLDHPDVERDDPAVAKAIEYILSCVQEDGGIYGNILANYNTSICVSALSRLRHDEPEINVVVQRAVAFLKGIQWQEGMMDPHGEEVTPEHPYYGGVGYGQHGRPDMSNVHFMVQALHDAGLDHDDPAYARAVVFIHRCQGVASNEMFAEQILQDGGVIYATSINKDLIGVPESKANPEQMDEAKLGLPVSGLRGYGSMTYAAFKSYIYASLDRSDPRVQAAYDWIRHNYTLERNPGMPEQIQKQGLFYYYMVFSRALAAWGDPMLEAKEKSRRWGNDLAVQLVQMQDADGSWSNEADRWMEGDPDLVTAYALLALQDAMLR